VEGRRDAADGATTNVMKLFCTLRINLKNARSIPGTKYLIGVNLQVFRAKFLMLSKAVLVYCMVYLCCTVNTGGEGTAGSTITKGVKPNSCLGQVFNS